MKEWLNVFFPFIDRSTDFGNRRLTLIIAPFLPSHSAWGLNRNSFLILINSRHNSFSRITAHISLPPGGDLSYQQQSKAKIKIQTKRVWKLRNQNKWASREMRVNPLLDADNHLPPPLWAIIVRNPLVDRPRKRARHRHCAADHSGSLRSSVIGSDLRRRPHMIPITHSDTHTHTSWWFV